MNLKMSVFRDVAHVVWQILTDVLAASMSP
jgi:hypothetical protein